MNIRKEIPTTTEDITDKNENQEELLFEELERINDHLADIEVEIEENGEGNGKKIKSLIEQQEELKQEKKRITQELKEIENKDDNSSELTGQSKVETETTEPEIIESVQEPEVENSDVVDEKDFLEDQISKLENSKDPILRKRRDNLMKKRSELVAEERGETRKAGVNQKIRSEQKTVKEQELEEKKWDEFKINIYTQLYEILKNEYDKADNKKIYIKETEDNLKNFTIEKIKFDDAAFLKKFDFNKEDKENQNRILELYKNAGFKILDEFKNTKKTKEDIEENWKNLEDSIKGTVKNEFEDGSLLREVYENEGKEKARESVKNSIDEENEDMLKYFNLEDNEENRERVNDIIMRLFDELLDKIEKETEEAKEKLESEDWSELDSSMKENLSRVQEAYEKSDDKDEFIDGFLDRYSLEKNKDNRDKLKELLKMESFEKPETQKDEDEQAKELLRQYMEDYEKAVKNDSLEEAREISEKIRALGLTFEDVEEGMEPIKPSKKDEPKKFELNEARKESLRKTNEIEKLRKENEDILSIPWEDLTDEQRKIRERIEELEIGRVLDESSAVFTDHVRSLEEEVGKPVKEGILVARERCEDSFALLNATKMLKMGLEMKMQKSKKQRRTFPSVGKLGNAVKNAVRERLKDPFKKKEKAEKVKTISGVNEMFSSGKRKDLNSISEQGLANEFETVLEDIHCLSPDFNNKTEEIIKDAYTINIKNVLRRINAEDDIESKRRNIELFFEKSRIKIEKLPDDLNNPKEYLNKMLSKVEDIFKEKIRNKGESIEINENQANEQQDSDFNKFKIEIIEQLKNDEKAVQELGELVGFASFVNENEKIGKLIKDGMEDSIKNKKLKELLEKEGIKDLTVKEVKEIYDELKTYIDNLNSDQNDKTEDNQVEIETAKELEISVILLANDIKKKDLDKIIEILDEKYYRVALGNRKLLKVVDIKEKFDNEKHKQAIEDILSKDKNLSIIDLKNIIKDVKKK